MLPRLQPFISIAPSSTPEGSAYIPAVFLSRGLAFLRFLVIARLLGPQRLADFGLYRPVLDLINWPVALVLFGLADVVERYAAAHERAGALGPWLRGQYLRIAFTAVPAALVVAGLSPWISQALWGIPPGPEDRRTRIVLICLAAVVIVLLAYYQHLAALLRGLRAYAAAAGMELLSACLLLVLSTIAALGFGAVALMIAYAVSVLIPIGIYAVILRRHLHANSPKAGVTPGDPAVLPGNSSGFAFWTFLRLLLMMTFPLLSFWAVGILTRRSAEQAVAPDRALALYALPMSIAQILAFIAVTFWSSTYAIAANALSRGRRHAASVQLFRVGKFGVAIISLVAVGLLLCRGILIAFLPDYTDALNTLLPPMLALFIWHGFLTLANTYADLLEKPQRATLLWLAVILFQAGLIALSAAKILPLAADAGEQVLYASVIAFAIPVLILAPVLLLRPWKLSATGIPLVIFAVMPLSLLCPNWVVDYIAAPVMLAALVFLQTSKLLVRPIDRRALRRRMSRKHPMR